MALDADREKFGESVFQQILKELVKFVMSSIKV